MKDQIFKKIHDDGSETVIKQVRPVQVIDGETVEGDALVTSIFISSSVGCYYKCKFCHLTEGKMPTKGLCAADIVENVIEAVGACDFIDPTTRLKLCFMGMGDAMLDVDKLKRTLECLCNWFDNVFQVDISTVRIKNAGNIEVLNEILKGIPIRLFFSAHSGMDHTRDIILPNNMSKLHDQLCLLDGFLGELKIHYTPVAGISDHDLDAWTLAQKLDGFHRKGVQVRMLELNPYPGSILKRPSVERMQALYNIFKYEGIPVKWQVSKGAEENSACGMFQGGTAGGGMVFGEDY